MKGHTYINREDILHFELAREPKAVWLQQLTAQVFIQLYRRLCTF